MLRNGTIAPIQPRTPNALSMVTKPANTLRVILACEDIGEQAGTLAAEAGRDRNESTSMKVTSGRINQGDSARLQQPEEVEPVLPEP